MIVGNALWQLVVQSDAMTKMVLLILLVMSIVCWTLFLYKCVLIRTQKRQLADALESAGHSKDLEHVRLITARFIGTMPGRLLAPYTAFVQCYVQTKKHGLSAEDRVRLQEDAYDTIDSIVYQEDSMLSWLSTSAALSPLLGLFGTVWGLIHSFIRISEKQSADITTVAPGIAEALITTLAGLMVAIPALAMYNYLISQSSVIEQRLQSLAHAYMRVLERCINY